MFLTNAFIKVISEGRAVWLRADALQAIEQTPFGSVVYTATGEWGVAESTEDVLGLLREATRALRRAEAAGMVGPIATEAAP